MLKNLLKVSALAIFACAGCVPQEQFPDDEMGQEDGKVAEALAKQDGYYSLWFAEHLRAMKEPGLASASLSSNEKFVLRLTVLPTFDPGHMMKVTFDSGDQARYELKTLSGMGGYEPGHLKSQKKGNLTADQTRELLAMLEGLGVRKGTVRTEDRNPEYGCVDGTNYLFEFLWPAGYVAAERHECDMYSQHQLVPLLLRLDDYANDKIDVSEVILRNYSAKP